VISPAESCPQKRFQLCPRNRNHFALLPRNTSSQFPADICWYRE
jgi:hypothetical protein